jgi:hypothetical protein
LPTTAWLAPKAAIGSSPLAPGGDSISGGAPMALDQTIAQATTKQTCSLLKDNKRALRCGAFR